jgi:hypothetical protein
VLSEHVPCVSANAIRTPYSTDFPAPGSTAVIAGLDPAIHLLAKKMDHRVSAHAAKFTLAA